MVVNVVKVAVLADTHTRGMSRSLPAGAWPYLEGADHILHAGDVVDPALLHDLAALAPTTAVMGNCDASDVRDWGALESAQLDLEGVVVAMVHDAGPAARRREFLLSRFPQARVAVYGHSHVPENSDDGSLLLFNPGSPTWKRRAPFCSMGMLWIEDGSVDGEIFPV